MKTYLYSGENPGEFPGGRELAGGFGFTAAGFWRGLPIPEAAAGLLVDDRHPPNPRGLEAARAALAGWEGLVVLDFEKPPAPWAAALADGLDPARLIVPTACADLPHGALLAGPWRGNGSFRKWLAALRERYGPLVLDGAPIRAAARPGGAWTPWQGPLPGTGFPCPGPGCLHRRRSDGTLVFWVSRETLAARCAAAGTPVIVFEADLAALAAFP